MQGILGPAQLYIGILCAAGSRENLLSGALPSSPTAVIGGSNFSSNVARLSTNQRKRISSVDDLTALR